MSEWLWQKIDVFVAALFVAVVGIAACQSHVFMIQYLQRHGAELDAARVHLLDVQSGLRYRVMGDTVRAELERDAQGRYAILKRSQDAIAGTNGLIRPLALIKYRDAGTMERTWHSFVPGVPSTVGDVLYALVGALLGFVLYEVVKLPVVFMVREPRRRRFRRRG